MKKILEYIKGKPLVSLTLLFTASRIGLYPFFPFRINFLPWLNQLLDIDLLRHDLWHSLSYIHVTPPLYNVFIGLILNVFPESLLQSAFTTIYFLMGLGMVLLTYRILKYLQAPWWLSFFGGLTVIANPILFRFEIIPFYTYPLAFLILLSVFFLIKLLETSKRSYLVAFLATPLVILLFRNFFHIIFYFIPIAAATCYFVYRTRKQLFITAVIVSVVFFAIGVIPNIRNQINYGIFSSSTWQGMQLFSMTYFVPKDKIDALVKEGSVTPLAQIRRFQNPDAYYDYYNEPVRNDIPAIDALYKTEGDGQFGNFNNRIYARAAKEYGENAFKILAAYPQYFPERFLNSVYIFFSFANYRYFDKTADWLIFDGGPVKTAYQVGKYFVLPLLVALVFFFLLWELLMILLKAARAKKVFADETAIYLYSFFIILYTFGVANVVELGENYTARVPIDPPLILLTLYFFSKVASRPSKSKLSAS